MQDFDCRIATIQRLIRRRQSALVLGLAAAAGACALAVLHLPVVPKLLPGLLGAPIYLMFCAFDPTKSGFVHHRRIRWLGVALTFAVAIAGSLLCAQIAWMPLLFGVAIAHKHSQTAAQLSLATAREVTALRNKILVLETRRLNDDLLLAHSRDDKLVKAS